MKYSISIILVLFVCQSGFCQVYENNQIYTDHDAFNDPKNCITIGFLQGGGSLVGVDLEFKVYDRFGIQAGAGFVGFGGGLNLHFKPTLRSSFISLQYWHQGTGYTYAQSLLGPSLVYRARKLLSAQLGLGFVME
jgi:hypothetical protein